MPSADITNTNCFGFLRLLFYVSSFAFGAAVSFFDSSRPSVVVALDVGTFLLFAGVAVLDAFSACCTTRRVELTLKIWYLLKSIGLFALLLASWLKVTWSHVRLPQVVLVTLTFEGGCYIMWHYEAPWTILQRLRKSFTSVSWNGIMLFITICAFALMGWMLFSDITPEVLQADGNMGPDTLFTNIVFSFITLWQVAQADNVGQLTRTFERIRPGSSLFFVVFNFLVYYLLANLLLASLTSTYQSIEEVSTAAVTRSFRARSRPQPQRQHEQQQQAVAVNGVKIVMESRV